MTVSVIVQAKQTEVEPTSELTLSRQKNSHRHHVLFAHSHKLQLGFKITTGVAQNPPMLIRFPSIRFYNSGRRL